MHVDHPVRAWQQVIRGKVATVMTVNKIVPSTYEETWQGYKLGRAPQRRELSKALHSCHEDIINYCHLQLTATKLGVRPYDGPSPADDHLSLALAGLGLRASFWLSLLI